MDTNRWTSLNRIVDQALDLPEKEQVGFIKNYEGLNDRMRDEALSFLKSIHKSDTFWDSLIASSSSLIEQIEDVDSLENPANTRRPPDQVGPYKIIRKLASGGMGNVYLAERTDGHLQITVALKLIKRECIDSHHIYQFNIERNVLARLNHPNIARIYDGGITDEGQPYLVMEYVKGTTVTTYCSSKQCTVDQKLSLFEQICDGVNFAHTNLIVHRDLKPDNIFLKENGTCKILDFGIAKILQPDGDSYSPLHASESRLKPFSIRYAAPEQLNGGDITTATDVYALGLLLYELLTGTLPYELKQKSLSGALKTIKEHSWIPASDRINDKSVAKSIKGDLDEVLKKALRTAPGERYQSAGDLLADIRNVRSGRPLSFRQHQTAYKLKKFAGRNIGILSAIAAVFTLIVFMSVYFIISVQQERQKAIAEEQQASFIAGFMIDLFDASDPVNNVNDTLTVYDILTSGREKLDNWDGSELSKADIQLSLGNAYEKIGDYEQSKTLIREAFDVIKTETGDSLSADMIRPAVELARLYRNERNFTYAAHHYDQSLKIIEIHEQIEPELIVSSLSGYGNTLSELGNPELAIIYLNKALNKAKDAELSDSYYREIQINLAQAYRRNGDYEESETLYKDVLSRTPAEISHTEEVSVIHNNLGYLMKIQDRFEEAIKHYKLSLDIHNVIYGSSHPKTKVIMNNLSALHSSAGNFQRAEEIRLDLLDLTREEFGESHWRTGSAYESLGILKLQAGALEEAPNYFNIAQSIYSEVLGSDHIWTERVLLYYALCRFTATDSELAKIQFREAFESLKSKRVTFSRFDVDLIRNLVRNFESYPSIKNSPDFALLDEID